jgi:DNA-binding transcriptional MerR regulator
MNMKDHEKGPRGPVPDVSDRFLKTREVMKILACSRDYLTRLRVEKKLVPIERGKTHHVYSLQDVERYMKAERERARQGRVSVGSREYSSQDLENLKLIGFVPK